MTHKAFYLRHFLSFRLCKTWTLTFIFLVLGEFLITWDLEVGNAGSQVPAEAESVPPLSSPPGSQSIGKFFSSGLGILLPELRIRSKWDKGRGWWQFKKQCQALEAKVLASKKLSGVLFLEHLGLFWCLPLLLTRSPSTVFWEPSNEVLDFFICFFFTFFIVVQVQLSPFSLHQSPQPQPSPLVKSLYWYLNGPRPNHVYLPWKVVGRSTLAKLVHKQHRLVPWIKRGLLFL